MRAELVHRLAATGVPRIEITSFVNPDKVPQMAHPEQVVAAVEPHPGVAYSALVLNERGYARLAETTLAGVNFSFAITDSYNRRNQGQTVEQSIAAATRVVKSAKDSGRHMAVTFAVSFGCPFEGRVEPAWVYEVAGASSTPARTSWCWQTRSASRRRAAWPSSCASSRRPAPDRGAPAQHAQHRVSRTPTAPSRRERARIDACVGGIGGCPFAPRATGNIATEDLVYLLDEEGIETGIDLDTLIGVATWLEGVLGRQLEGQVYRAGGFPSSIA